MRQPTGIDRTIALGMLGAGVLVAIAAPAASATTAGSAAPRTTAQMYQAELSRIGQIKLYPLAGTAVDPLSNNMGTDLGGLPVSTAPVSALFADGLPVRDLPLVNDMLAPPAAANTGTDADDDTAAPPASNTAVQPASNADARPASNADAPVAVAAPGAPAAALAPAAATQGPLFGPLQ